MWTGRPQAAIVAPSVPTSTISDRREFSTTITFVPSIVAPRAMPTIEMRMPMAVPNFISVAPCCDSVSCSAASALSDGTPPSPAVPRTSESALARRGTRDIASSTDARHTRTASATSSGVSVTSSREPVVSVTTVSGSPRP